MNRGVSHEEMERLWRAFFSLLMELETFSRFVPITRQSDLIRILNRAWTRSRSVPLRCIRELTVDGRTHRCGRNKEHDGKCEFWLSVRWDNEGEIEFRRPTINSFLRDLK